MKLRMKRKTKLKIYNFPINVSLNLRPAIASRLRESTGGEAKGIFLLKIPNSRKNRLSAFKFEEVFYRPSSYFITKNRVGNNLFTFLMGKVV